MADVLVVSSVNCRGLQGLPKRRDVLDYISKQNSNIICLQDTHWLNSDEQMIHSQWNNPCYINGYNKSSRGTAILFKNNFEHKVLHYECDTSGNYQSIDLKISNEITLQIINIYAPNTDSPEFFKEIKNLMYKNNSEYLLICGDYNLALNQALDTKNYKNINNPQAREFVLNMMRNDNLIDSFRHFHPDLKHFSWSRKNPTKFARLDYFLVSSQLIDLIEDSTITHGYRSDHSMINLKLKISPFKRGKGIWKLNCSLLKDPKYLELINAVIKEERANYAVPVYNREIIDAIPDANLELIIPKKDFLELLLLRIRGETIRYASVLKRNTRKRELQLISDIEELEKNRHYSNNNDGLDDKKAELEEIRNIELKGRMIRSRVQWLDEGEKPTKLFCSLENQNYIDKTIKKIQLNNTVITDQKSILDKVANFYGALFSNKDTELNDVNLDEKFKNITVEKLNSQESDSIEGLLTIEEIGAALNKMKNNKTPGIDGFPADFFKVFWSSLKTFVLNALNESYLDGKMSISLRQCIISCLPKGEKDRSQLKNWRPVSLLSVVYKIASASIAARLKRVIDKLISKTQSGFLQGRFIGECTRLVYDVMHYCQEQNLDGLLMLVDFEKAFDSVSWNFLYKTLKFFNIGESIQQWVKLFNSDITATVLQCGITSKFFPIERGCRQGDPIATYLFLLAAQILFLMISNNKNIKGIRIGNAEFLISQFADDTTLILDASRQSLSASLNTLEVFGSMSGLTMNKEKTKVVWIGRKRFSKEKIDTNFNLQWGVTQFDLLGLKYNVSLNEMLDTNYDKAYNSIKGLLKAWNKRYLTPIGKITVIKTFILSKFIHLFTTLPFPTEAFISKLSSDIFSFIWSGKPDKIKRTRLIQPYVNGGLNMFDLKSFIKSLKLSWLRRLIVADNQPWVQLVQTLFDSKKILIFGPLYADARSNTITNPFWKDVLKSWSEICKLHMPLKIKDGLTSPLWYNDNISSIPLFVSTWYKQGISLVADIVGDNLKVLSHADIMRKWNVNEINFLQYFRLAKTVNQFISKFNLFSKIIHPAIPFHYNILCKHKKGVKDMINIFNTKNQVEYNNSKWEFDLQIKIDQYMWKQTFKTCFKSVNDNYLIWHQYKILNRILGTKLYLTKVKISNDSMCSFCNNVPESLLHLYFQCPLVEDLWNNIQIWIYNKLGFNVPLDDKTIILGHLTRDNLYYPLNLIILRTKAFIFQHSKSSKMLNIYMLQRSIKKTYIEQFLLAKINLKEENFTKSWQPWLPLFDLID